MLEILIASIEERNLQLAKLLQEFEQQGARVITNVDNRTKTIGKKRQELLEQATAEWVAFFDDDDWPSENYIRAIIRAIQKNPDADCCGIWGKMTTNGSGSQAWCHRLGFEIDHGIHIKRKTGFDYIRPIWHFNPVRRRLALQAGFDTTMSFGEDKDYALRLNPLLKKEAWIPEPLFLYRYSNKTPLKEKYGING